MQQIGMQNASPRKKSARSKFMRSM